VLADLMMPRMDGLELVEEVCSRSPGTPVILMTARGSEQIAVQALQMGAAGYVPKSVLHEQLVAVVQRVLSVARIDRRRQALPGRHRSSGVPPEPGKRRALIPVFIATFRNTWSGMGLCDNNRIRAGVAGRGPLQRHAFQEALPAAVDAGDRQDALHDRDELLVAALLGT